jgi:hypothetical protein
VESGAFSAQTELLNISKLKWDAMATQLDTFFGFIPNSPKTINFLLVGQASKEFAVRRVSEEL